jgi:hypothetical protein
MDPLTLTLTAIAESAKAVAAVFTYLAEHEKGLTKEQREATNQVAVDNLQWWNEQGKEFLGLLKRLPTRPES